MDHVALNQNDIDEVKESIGETDMQNSIICPTCKKIVKKKTELNELKCDF
jgi:hypothetical protein